MSACPLSASVHLSSSAVPALRPVLHIYPLSPADWLIVVVLVALQVNMATLSWSELYAHYAEAQRLLPFESS